jgi:two-component system sensor histidine kinase UhpB
MFKAPNEEARTSLRYQITGRILCSALVILVLAGTLALWQARAAVNKEIDSSVNLAVQLMNFGFSRMGSSDNDWLRAIQSLNQTRHLSIQLQTPAGAVLARMDRPPKKAEDRLPPNWFIHLVGGKQTKTEHTVATVDGKQYRLVMQANPLDEITEVWEEAITFLASFFLLTLLIFLAVHLVFDKALKAIQTIVEALKLIETGDYRHTLPAFAVQEYDAIAKAINHMTGELNKARLENRALTQHSLAIQEDERKHLAQELHDELGQSLTAIKVMAVTATQPGADIRQSTGTIVDVCNHLVTVVRSMMRQLHPLVLTELGLTAALEDLLNHWDARNPDLKFTLHCDKNIDSLSADITIQVFRIVQECLTNIVRHAEADSAEVALSIERLPEPALTLTVNDDGRGCAPDLLKKGFGLLSIKERVNSLNGDVKTTTYPSRGMRIDVRIPVYRDDHKQDEIGKGIGRQLGETMASRLSFHLD